MNPITEVHAKMLKHFEEKHPNIPKHKREQLANTLMEFAKKPIRKELQALAAEFDLRGYGHAHQIVLDTLEHYKPNQEVDIE